LIVDDMAQVRRDLRTILPLAGEMSAMSIEIVGEAADGYDAIRLAGELRPDVILMDLSMPRLNGYSATHEIKALYPKMKILVLTVHSAHDARLKACQAGADGFIEKGALVTEIIHQIQSFA
jgi:two-component system response regulator NreC